MMLCDFRSDTVTLPTKAMMDAIAAARLGDAARGDDPTVNELEAVAAKLTGKEEALFVPSGTMANLSAVIAHGCRGGEVIVEADAHIYNSEGGGLSVVAGAVARPVPGAYGAMDLAALRSAIRAEENLALAPSRLICVENTHNSSGGSVLPLAYLADVAALAEDAKLPVHMDGARLLNAAAYLDVPVAEICTHVDSVWFALCKGLGAPVGAVLTGTRDFMRGARRAAKMLGGGMRQAGLLAAPALVGLARSVETHKRDHEMAQRLASGIHAINPSLVEVDRVQTNIVNVYVDPIAAEAGGIVRALAERGVRTNGRGRKIRFVTHYHIDETAVDAAVAAFAAIVDDMRSVA